MESVQRAAAAIAGAPTGAGSSAQVSSSTLSQPSATLIASRLKDEANAIALEEKALIAQNSKITQDSEREEWNKRYRDIQVRKDAVQNLQRQMDTSPEGLIAINHQLSEFVTERTQYGPNATPFIIGVVDVDATMQAIKSQRIELERTLSYLSEAEALLTPEERQAIQLGRPVIKERQTTHGIAYENLETQALQERRLALLNTSNQLGIIYENLMKVQGLPVDNPNGLAVLSQTKDALTKMQYANLVTLKAEGDRAISDTLNDSESTSPMALDEIGRINALLLDEAQAIDAEDKALIHKLPDIKTADEQQEWSKRYHSVQVRKDKLQALQAQVGTTASGGGVNTISFQLAELKAERTQYGPNSKLFFYSDIMSLKAEGDQAISDTLNGSQSVSDQANNTSSIGLDASTLETSNAKRGIKVRPIPHRHARRDVRHSSASRSGGLQATLPGLRHGNHD